MCVCVCVCAICQCQISNVLVTGLEGWWWEGNYVNSIYIYICTCNIDVYTICPRAYDRGKEARIEETTTGDRS